MLHVSIILTVFTTGSNDKFLKLWILLHFISYVAQSAMDETSDSGAFIRTASTFHNVISRYLSCLFPAEVGRYHLYMSCLPLNFQVPCMLEDKRTCKAISFMVSKSFSMFQRGRIKILWPNQYCLFVAQSIKSKWKRTKETDEHMGWVFPSSGTEEPGAINLTPGYVKGLVWGLIQ